MCLEAGLEDPRPTVLGSRGVTAVLLYQLSWSTMNKMDNPLILQGQELISIRTRLFQILKKHRN